MRPVRQYESSRLYYITPIMELSLNLYCRWNANLLVSFRVHQNFCCIARSQLHIVPLIQLFLLFKFKFFIRLDKWNLTLSLNVLTLQQTNTVLVTFPTCIKHVLYVSEITWHNSIWLRTQSTKTTVQNVALSLLNFSNHHDHWVKKLN